jgi:hypothetical protein
MDPDLGLLPDEDTLTDEEYFEHYGEPRGLDPDLWRKQRIEDEL